MDGWIDRQIDRSRPATRRGPSSHTLFDCLLFISILWHPVDHLKGLKHWLERVAARVALETPVGSTRVALETPVEGFEGFEGGQTAVLNALKNRWLGRVAARVALERPAEGFEALSGACSCESCLGKACGKLRELPKPEEGPRNMPDDGTDDKAPDNMDIGNRARSRSLSSGIKSPRRFYSSRAKPKMGRGVRLVLRNACGSLERPEKQMAGACSCESCLRKACGRV